MQGYVYTEKMVQLNIKYLLEVQFKALVRPLQL